MHVIRGLLFLPLRKLQVHVGKVANLCDTRPVPHFVATTSLLARTRVAALEESMWRKCMTLVLVMAAITSGQISSAQEAGQQPGFVLEKKQIAKPYTALAQTSMRYNKLRRGQEEEIAISIIISPVGIPAPPGVSTPGNPVYFTPEIFSIKADPGFTVR